MKHCFVMMDKILHRILEMSEEIAKEQPGSQKMEFCWGSPLEVLICMGISVHAQPWQGLWSSSPVSLTALTAGDVPCSPFLSLQKVTQGRAVLDTDIRHQMALGCGPWVTAGGKAAQRLSTAQGQHQGSPEGQRRLPKHRPQWRWDALDTTASM